ncbi:MAG: Rrf2 family transcriptional regulator [Anaerolineales bacterium]|nr:Rrf2 family transcriptional regulator [Anaerolineales bacterium]
MAEPYKDLDDLILQTLRLLQAQKAGPGGPAMNIGFIAERFNLDTKQTDALIQKLRSQGLINAVKGMGSHYEYQACEITAEGLEWLQNQNG